MIIMACKQLQIQIWIIQQRTIFRQQIPMDFRHVNVPKSLVQLATPLRSVVRALLAQSSTLYHTIGIIQGAGHDKSHARAMPPSPGGFYSRVSPNLLLQYLASSIVANMSSGHALASYSLRQVSRSLLLWLCSQLRQLYIKFYQTPRLAINHSKQLLPSHGQITPHEKE